MLKHWIEFIEFALFLSEINVFSSKVYLFVEIIIKLSKFI